MRPWLGWSSDPTAVFMEPPNSAEALDVPTATASGPWASITFDPAGNVYGTTYGGGAYGLGNVFKLTNSNGGWTYSSLYDFSGNSGYGSFSNIVFDANRNLYGTASQGGNLNCNAPNGCGVVWEITP